MIDIHAHILPGMDDGARDIYDMLEMASIAADSGVTAIVATPHCNIPGYYDNYFDKYYIEVFKKASEALRSERIPVKLLPGMEVFATYDLPKLIEDEKIMPLNQSRYILMEFDFEEDPGFASDVLRRVVEVGAKPVVAHVERYACVQENPDIIKEWHKKGYAIQVNKGSFLGGFGRHAQHTAYRLLKQDLVSVVASDAHSPYSRTPYLREAYEEICAEYSKEKADWLFHMNPRCICNNTQIRSMEMITYTEHDRWERSGT